MGATASYNKPGMARDAESRGATISKVTTTKSQYALAGDIGGTNIRAALVDSEGRITGRGSIDTLPERGIDNASERLARLLKSALSTAPAGAEIVGVGVSTAGPIRPATGTYNHPPNLPGWNGKTMKPSLTESMGIPVWVGHDATLAALAVAGSMLRNQRAIIR